MYEYFPDMKESFDRIKEIEDFAQPRLLSHLIEVGRMLEAGLHKEKGKDYGLPVEER